MLADIEICVRRLKLPQNPRSALCENFEQFRRCRSGFSCPLHHRITSEIDGIYHRISNTCSSDNSKVDSALKEATDVVILLSDIAHYGSFYGCFHMPIVDLASQVTDILAYKIYSDAARWNRFPFGFRVHLFNDIFVRIVDVLLQQQGFLLHTIDPTTKAEEHLFKISTLLSKFISARIENNAEERSLRENILRSSVAGLLNGDAAMLLQHHINSYVKDIDISIHHMKPQIEGIIADLYNRLSSSSLGRKFRIQLSIFGSNANNLSSPTSDLDVSLSLCIDNGGGAYKYVFVDQTILRRRKSQQRLQDKERQREKEGEEQRQGTAVAGLVASNVLRKAAYNLGERFEVKEMRLHARVPLLKLTHKRTKIEVCVSIVIAWLCIVCFYRHCAAVYCAISVLIVYYFPRSRKCRITQSLL